MDTLTLIALGYCIAVIFPVPWLSQFIINMWNKGGTLIGISQTLSSSATSVLNTTANTKPESSTTTTKV